MLAATIIVSIKIMGVTLIAASLVIPPVIARLLTDSFARMLVLSTLIGALAGFAGIYVSYYEDWRRARRSCCSGRAVRGALLWSIGRAPVRPAPGRARGRGSGGRGNRAAAGLGDPLAPQR